MFETQASRVSRLAHAVAISTRRELLALFVFESFVSKGRMAMVSALKQHQVKTKRPDAKKPEEAERRLPHERDESDDSEAGARPTERMERVDIKRAYEDLEEGQVNTDLRGVQGVDQVVNPPDDTAAGRARKQTPRAR
jgi:hypothetical protein